MIPLWKGNDPIYFGVITIIPFDNLHRQAYFVMHTFLVKIYCSCKEYHVSFPGSLLYCHPDTTLYDKVCQRLAAGRRFSPGTPVSSTNKTDCHDITEILLKMALSTI